MINHSDPVLIITSSRRADHSLLWWMYLYIFDSYTVFITLDVCVMFFYYLFVLVGIGPRSLKGGLFTKFQNCVLNFDDTAFAVIWKVGIPLKGLTTPVGSTWVSIVTRTDRPKSVRNRCVEVFGGVFLFFFNLTGTFVIKKYISL